MTNASDDVAVLVAVDVDGGEVTGGDASDLTGVEDRDVIGVADGGVPDAVTVFVT